MLRANGFALCAAVMISVLPVFNKAASAADPVSFSNPFQTAVATDDLNTDSHTRAGFGSNSASTTDGDGFSGFGTASVDQSVVFTTMTRTLSAAAQVSASATGGAFGGDFAASARANYNVPFTLARSQDVIFTDGGGESSLQDSHNNQIQPGTALLPAGDYTLAGSALVQVLGTDASQTRSGGYDVSLKFIIPGDTNGDGVVNFADLLTLAQHYGRSGATLADGDFDLSGTVGFPDLLLLAQNYGQTAMQATAFSVVPEPISGLLLIGLAPLLRRPRA